MRTLTLLFVVALAPACVKGNPIEFQEDESFLGVGGTLPIEGCGYSVTTRYGAETPRIATAQLGEDPTPKLVHLAIQGDPKTSMVVLWRTADETTRATEIRYAEGDGLSESALTETATGIEFRMQPLGDEFYRQHQVHLCGLKPGTAYSYQVGTDGYFSPVYSFRTAPDIAAAPDTEVVLAFVGDSRGGSDVWQSLIEQLLPRAPDLVLFSGDAVTFGVNQNEWDEFFARAEPLFARVPMVSAHGNHEVNSVSYYAQIPMPGDQENFGLDYGHAHITVGNDSPDDTIKLMTTYRDALRADFEASSSARWKLFMHHQPMYSASTRHGPSETLQAAWLDLVDTHQIDLVLNGHDHDYEVSKPLRGGAVQASNATGTVFVVAGGAGAELYDNGSEFWTEYSEKTYSAAIIDVRRDQMTMDAFRPDGTALPTGFTKSK